MRILISKSDALGDQILLTGLVASLREQWPDSTLVWHIRAGLESVGQLVPNSRVFAPDFTQSPTSEAARLLNQSPGEVWLLPFPLNPYTVKYSPELAGQLTWWRDFIRGGSWDLAFSPMVSRNWLSDFTVAASQAPRRIGYTSSPSCQPMISAAAALLTEADGRPLLTEEIPADPGNSELENLGRLAGQLTGRPVSVQPRLYLAPAGKEEVRQRWSLRAKPLLLFAPGVGTDRKRAWPLARFLGLADGLSPSDFDLRWLCGPQDEFFFQGFPVRLAESVVRYTEQDLGLVAALVASARCLVCNDTSLVHLAAAVNTPTLAVYGSAHGRRFIPGHGSVKVVQADIACRGCQWHCLFPAYECVQQLSLEQVQSAFRALLQQGDLSPVRVPMPLSKIVGKSLADEAGWARTAFQQKLIFQHWDGWARLLAMQELESKWMESHERSQELHRRLEKLNAATRNPVAFLRFLWNRFIRREPI